MRKLAALLLALTLALTAACALADEKAVIRRAIRYPGEDITIAIPAQYISFYRDNIGVSVSVTENANIAYARVQILPYDPNFSEADYFENVWLPGLRAVYTGKNYSMITDIGDMKTYTLAGREMQGRAYSLYLAKRDECGLVLLDRWQGRIVRYEVYYPKTDPDAALSLLSNLARGVTGSALAPAATKSALKTLACPQQGFSFSANPAYPSKYSDQDGVTLYTGTEGYLPYIMVYQSNNLIVEAAEYLKEQYTPHMEAQYGDNLLRSSVYDRFLIGGKELPAGRYEYNVNGNTVIMLRVMDSTGSRTVVYTAKFLQGQGDATMAALDAAVASFSGK